jgi:hypothetical protein
MSSSWSAEQVLALAPDPASAKAGKELAVTRKWKLLGRDERAVWGECQGSGSSPYQTKIDLGEPAFACSCPSRKFPCKHALGLFLMLAQQPSALKEGSPPGWVSDWLSGRDKKADQKAQKAQQAQQEIADDPEKARKAGERQQKAAAERRAKVEAGLADLERWMGDLARRGLAAVRSEPYSFWEWPASRMVDAQAPGVARLIRDLAGLTSSGDGWQDRLLERLGRLHLLLEGYRRLEWLPAENQADIRSLVGWTQSQEELLATGTGVRDRWLVLGQSVEEEERLRTQRRWLWGETTGRPALVLHFAFGTALLDTSLVPGTVLDAELVFFPGACPLRALVKDRFAPPEPIADPPGHDTLEAALAGYAAALGRNPWIERFPLALRAVQPVRRGEAWQVRDASGAYLLLSPQFATPWKLMALSGGQPLGLFGEFDGEVVLPLSLWVENRFVLTS